MRRYGFSGQEYVEERREGSSAKPGWVPGISRQHKNTLKRLGGGIMRERARTVPNAWKLGVNV
jgi:hypothetical protein